MSNSLSFIISEKKPNFYGENIKFSRLTYKAKRIPQMGGILTHWHIQSYFFLSNWSGNTEALIRSAGSTSRASAISKKTSRENPLARPGASIALIKDRLTPAFSASGAIRWGIIRYSVTVCYALKDIRCPRLLKKDTILTGGILYLQPSYKEETNCSTYWNCRSSSDALFVIHRLPWCDYYKKLKILIFLAFSNSSKVIDCLVRFEV